MAILPEDPRKQMMLLIVILAIAAGALYYMFLYSPAGLELSLMEDRIEDLDTQNRLAEARIGNLQQLRDRLTVAERQVQALQRLVPEGSEVPEIYEAIAAESQSLNLQLLSIEPLDPVPADSLGTLMRQEWQMVVEGEYHAIGQFFARVASFDRIVRPHLSSIVPAGVTAGGRQLVEATFGLETFVLGAGGLSAEPARFPQEESPPAGALMGGAAQ
ncbi:MAG: type 4a pilus biogenesis protein PilO [Gemmatimonadota bacterium]|nr:type 4a pilus biogenesis protein PilO [Gemmatimonadota bacterium]